MTPQQARIIDRLDQALAWSGCTHDFRTDVLPMLLDGRAQLWTHEQGAVVTELRQYPRFREARIWLVAGKLGDALALLPDIEDWARREGCTRLVADGRPQWAPIARRCGFVLTGICAAKSLGRAASAGGANA